MPKWRELERIERLEAECDRLRAENERLREKIGQASRVLWERGGAGADMARTILKDAAAAPEGATDGT